MGSTPAPSAPPLEGQATVDLQGLLNYKAITDMIITDAIGHKRRTEGILEAALTKNIEAQKLNKRTGVPTGGTPVNIPYGAILDDLIEDGNLIKFSYLGEPYQSSHDVLGSATTPIPGTQAEQSPAAASEREPGAMRTPAQALQWEQMTSSHDLKVMRAGVPGGWLVLISGAGLTYYPDPEHRWS